MVDSYFMYFKQIKKNKVKSRYTINPHPIISSENRKKKFPTDIKNKKMHILNFYLIIISLLLKCALKEAFFLMNEMESKK